MEMAPVEPSESPPEPARAGQAGPPLDLAEIAQRVYELLVRRLAAEREQRGW